MLLERIDTRPLPRKARTMKIIKQEVLDTIDLLTYKHVDGSGIEDARVRNATASDTSDNVDGTLIARLVEFRDAQLRHMIAIALAPSSEESGDNALEQSASYTYDLLLPCDFDDALLPALGEYMHRYMVYGVLYDWYAQLGNGQASVYAQELRTLGDSITSIIRGRSIHKRPLQPFGMAKPL